MTFRSMTLPFFALVAALAGCSAEAGTSAGAETTDDARSTVVAEQTGKEVGKEGKRGHGMRPMAHHRPGGPDFLVHAALRAPINLTAEQKATIEGLVKTKAHRGPAVDASRAQKLAAAIRNNSVATMERPQFDEKAREARIAESAKALATLHATLTPEQRVALVDSIEKHAPKHGGERGAHARKERPQRGHAERGHAERRPGAEGARGFHGRGGPMGLLAGLDLTQEQKDAIKAKLEAQRPAKPSAEQREAMKAKMETARAAMKAKLESFKGASFDATAFVTPPKDLPRPEMARVGQDPLAVITPLLTAEQREVLASRIEKGPALHEARVKAPARMTK